VACMLSKYVTIRCAVLFLKCDTRNILRYLATPSRTYGAAVEDKFGKLRWAEDTWTWSAGAEQGGTQSDERHKTGRIR